MATSPTHPNPSGWGGSVFRLWAADVSNSIW